MFRYLKYTCKDIYEHWIQHLDAYYENVSIFEKGYEFDDNRIETTQAIFHNEKKQLENSSKLNGKIIWNIYQIKYFILLKITKI
jgi:hypothetical protein